MLAIQFGQPLHFEKKCKKVFLKCFDTFTEDNNFSIRSFRIELYSNAKLEPFKL